MNKTPEQIDAIINEIIELEEERDLLWDADDIISTKKAFELDEKIVTLIFDELTDDADFVKYAMLSRTQR